MAIKDESLEDVSQYIESKEKVDDDFGSWSIHPKILAQFEDGVGEGLQWAPKSLINHSRAFVNWINSITHGIFPNMLTYYPYERYKMEAYTWLKERVNPIDMEDDHLAADAMLEELRRIDRNTLYFACKYGKVKEGNNESGILQYRAKEHNAFLFYLLDCGYCLLIGKPRQIFATTTLGMFAIKRLVTRYNYYMKFITSTDEKGLEIMRDKFKFCFEWLPYWMKNNVISDALGVLHLGEKTKKGDVGFPNSRLEQVAPSSTAINGGSPQMSLLDEIGELPDLIETLLEIRPTLYVDTNQDGNLKLKRSIICWGTGVTNTIGNKGFEKLWTSTLKLWDEGNYQGALFVPIFMSWHCRATKEFYEQEKAAYLSATGMKDLADVDEKQREEIFNMHYPTTYRDMFGGSSNLLLDRDFIVKQRERIREMRHDYRPVLGWFEPIYDQTKPEPETSDTPFKIVGSVFVPADDNSDMDKVSAAMMLRPNYDWENRYFQGTDPISNETGISFMASAIWDRHVEALDRVTEAPVCLIYHRKAHDPKSTFLQCLLMGLYYDTNHPEGAKQGVPELIENNIGGNYKEYQENKGFYKRIVFNKQLPDNDMMGGGPNWGINTSGRGQNRRKMRVVYKMRELAKLYGNNIHFDVFWKEMETYVNHMKSEETWGPMDKRNNRDDALDGITFSYICSLAHANLPTRKREIDASTLMKVRYVQRRLPNGELVMEPERVRV